MKPIQFFLTLLLAFPLALGAKEVDREKASAQVDALIAKGYAANDVKANPLSDDATFVRRAYLDIAGRIPTAAETRAFISSMEPTKRTDLIDQLLDSDGYVSHQFNYWADILRITTRMNGQGPQNGAAYINWVKDAIRNNLPYDQFAHSLVTAQGMIDQNGAVGFYLRDRGMPLDHLATTVQVFLGTQMVCAQCHDHPFDEWTQMNYYELAAFSTPMDVVRNPDSITKTIAMVNQEARAKQQAISIQAKQGRPKGNDKNRQNASRKKESKERQTISNEAKATTRSLGQLSYNFRNSVIGETKKQLKLPHDYQYNDAKPEEVIHPLTPFGDRITVAEGESRVQAYGKWMTSPSNPRFTKTIANRLWKRVMGVGLIEPVDNITEDTEPTNPELLAYLEKLLVDLDYDLKAYYRVLYNTKTYQREAASVDLLAKYYYPGPRLRRMSAEQVWDSLVTLIRPDLDAATDPRAQNDSGDDSRMKAWERIEAQTPEALLKREKALAAYTKKSTERIDQFRAEVEKAIATKNQKRAVELAPQIVDFNRDATREYARLTYWEIDSFGNRYFQTPFRNTPNSLVRQLRNAFPKASFPDDRAFRMANNPAMMMMSGKKDRANDRDKAEQKKLRSEMSKQEYAEYQRERSSRGRRSNYVRASEISSPAPDGHFLRTFGQSDRLLIENADDGASVPQTLALMNGQLFSALTDPYSVIAKEVRAAGDDHDAAIDAIYLSMLARKPSESERSLVRSEFDATEKSDEAAKGIIWALLNTQQFLFVQ